MTLQSPHAVVRRIRLLLGPASRSVTCAWESGMYQRSEMYPAVMFADLEENKAVSEVVNKYFLMKGDHMDREEYKRVIKGLSRRKEMA